MCCVASNDGTSPQGVSEELRLLIGFKKPYVLGWLLMMAKVVLGVS